MRFKVVWYVRLVFRVGLFEKNISMSNTDRGGKQWGPNRRPESVPIGL